MSDLNRREALRAFLRGALQAGGTAVLATAVLPAAAQGGVGAAAETLRVRADRLAAGSREPAQEVEELCTFANGAFANGGFRNAGTQPVGGAFKNGGSAGTFANAGTHPVGGFTNGAFRNAGFRNG